MWHLIVREEWRMMGWDSKVEGGVGISSYLLASSRHFFINDGKLYSTTLSKQLRGESPTRGGPGAFYMWMFSDGNPQGSRQCWRGRQLSWKSWESCNAVSLVMTPGAKKVCIYVPTNSGIFPCDSWLNGELKRQICLPSVGEAGLVKLPWRSGWY